MCHKFHLQNFFIHNPLRPLPGQCFSCTHLSQLLLSHLRFLSQFYEKQHTFMFLPEIISCPIKFYQSRLRNCYHQCMAQQIKFLHIQRTWSIRVAHTQTANLLLQAGSLLYMPSTLLLSTQLYYTHRALCRNIKLYAYTLCTCIYFT